MAYLLEHNSNNCHQFSMFFFSEYNWKENIIDNDEDDTMEFDMWKKYVFRANLSEGLTGNEVVTVLHPGSITIKKSILLKYS